MPSTITELLCVIVIETEVYINMNNDIGSS